MSSREKEGLVQMKNIRNFLKVENDLKVECMWIESADDDML